MKITTKFLAVLTLLIWGVITVLLCVSIVGLLALVLFNEGDYWNTIPDKLVQYITE